MGGGAARRGGAMPTSLDGGETGGHRWRNLASGQAFALSAAVACLLGGSSAVAFAVLGRAL